MKRNFLLLAIALLLLPIIARSQEKEHPTVSLGFTEEIRGDAWFDDYSMDVRAFKNLENGFAIGGKIGTDFVEKVDFGLALRKSVVQTLFFYGDTGYAVWDEDGFFGEAGLGAYFLRHNQLGFTGGVKHYFKPNITSFAVGFIVNF